MALKTMNSINIKIATQIAVAIPEFLLSPLWRIKRLYNQMPTPALDITTKKKIISVLSLAESINDYHNQY